ncbi:MAG: outer membrane lipoprotein carrier protein LolA [Terriglobales bacterium]
MTHPSHRRHRTVTFSVLSAFLFLATTAFPQVMGIGRYVATIFWQSDPAGLERVLTQMDTAAKNFHTAQANLTADQYTKVVDEKETQKGKVYYERRGNEVDMAAAITEPDKQYAIYANGKAQVYNPKIDQVNEYQPGKSRSQIEAFLLLGFGGGGHALLSTYDVKYLGSESVNGINAAKLELTPKSQQLLNNISRILLWIDPAKGVAVQMQLFFPGGDYRLTRYSDIQINQRLPDNAFKLKTTGKTKFVSPQG